MILDEKLLEEDAINFDTFLKENDKNSVEAIKRSVLKWRDGRKSE